MQTRFRQLDKSPVPHLLSSVCGLTVCVELLTKHPVQNYGQASTIDQNNQYYQQYMAPYKGTYGTGSPNGVNHFWPIPGNHGGCLKGCVDC